MKLLLSSALCQVLSKENRFFGFLTLGLTPQGSTSVSSSKARVSSNLPPFYRKAFVGFFYNKGKTLRFLTRLTMSVQSRSHSIHLQINILFSYDFVKEYP
jgi:hypothetical protein